MLCCISFESILRIVHISIYITFLLAELYTWIQILDKGELQVAGKERESQLSSQFRDIATIVMQKTINPETQRPYTISMIERLMHEIHFAVDPHNSSKKQVISFASHPSWQLLSAKKLVFHPLSTND